MSAHPHGAVTVLVGALCHPVSQRPCRCPADAQALALALTLGLPLRLLSAGNMPDRVARDYLAGGAPLIEIVEIAALAQEPDAFAPAAQSSALLRALLPHVHGSAWVFTGTRRQHGGTGVLPYALAAALGRSIVSDVLTIEPGAAGWSDKAIEITQALPRGARRRLRVQAPAVLAISAAAALQPRHSFAAALAGRIVRLPAAATATASEAGTATSMPGERVPARRLRVPLAASAAQGAAQRMSAAIDAPASGGTVLVAPDARAKAQALLDYLLRNALLAQAAPEQDDAQHGPGH